MQRRQRAVRDFEILHFKHDSLGAPFKQFKRFKTFKTLQGNSVSDGLNCLNDLNDLNWPRV